MKYTKKFLLLSLCLALFLSGTGCSNTKTETTAAETTANDALDTTPAETEFSWKNGVNVNDYGGYTFTLLNGCTASWYSYTLIVPEESTGEPVNDAFYERNMRVNELLNVEITENNVSDSITELRNGVKSRHR